MSSPRSLRYPARASAITTSAPTVTVGPGSASRPTARVRTAAAPRAPELITDAGRGGIGGASDPAHYWSGLIPEVVVLDRAGTVTYRAAGQVPVGPINQAISKATGIPLPEADGTREVTESFNELNSEVVSLKP